MNVKKMMALSTPQWFAVADGETAARVDISGVIGGSFFSDGTTAKALIDQCKAIKANVLDVHICSPGGDVSEGLSIYSYLSGLKAQGKTVNVFVDGLAASIASVIAMAGDTRTMAKSAAMHVHNAWTFSMGNASAFRATADQLEKVTGQLSGVYQARTGLDAAKIKSLMDGPEGADGTLMTADEALKLGFVDALEENKKAAACVGGDIWPGVPAALVKEDPENPEKPEAPEKKPGDPENPDQSPAPAPAPAPAPEPPPAPAPAPAPGKKKEGEEEPDPELEKLKTENAALKARLDRVAKNGLAPHATPENSALDWKSALAAVGGDYVKARTLYPAAYAAFMHTSNR